MAKKTSTALSHSTLAFSLLIALVAILVLLVVQVQNKQTTGSEARQRNCLVSLRSVSLISNSGDSCRTGTSRSALITCTDGYSRVDRPEIASCRTRVDWRIIGEWICTGRSNCRPGPSTEPSQVPPVPPGEPTVTPYYRNIPLPTQNPY